MSTKSSTKTNHTHTNFSKFLITVIIFLSVVVLALFSILWEQVYENKENNPALEESEEVSLIENLPAEPDLASNISMEEVQDSQTDQNKEWTVEITLAPANLENYTKEIQKDFDELWGGPDILCGIEGSVKFDSERYPIHIINENLRNEKNSGIIDYIITYYEKAERISRDEGGDNRTLSIVFDQDCIPRGYLLDQLSYASEILDNESFDGYRIIFDGTSNYILAKKDDNYILITLKDNIELPLQSEAIDNCIKGGYAIAYSEETIECLTQSYKNQDELKEELFIQAQKAIEETNIQ